MSNRAQRRAMMRSQTERSKALIADYNRQQRIAGLIQNGITAEDLENERQKGYEDGLRQSAEPIIKCCYAAIILALHDDFGFNEEQCYRAINSVDRKTIWALNHSELADEVLEKTDIELIMDDPFCRVQRKEKT